MKSDMSALLVARPGRVRDGLQALLTATPQIAMIDQADDGSSVLRFVGEHHPSLVLLDTDLPNDSVWAMLRTIKTVWPQTLCLVLTDNSRSERTAKVAGADGVLLKGFLTGELFAEIERLLSY